MPPTTALVNLPIKLVIGVDSDVGVESTWIASSVSMEAGTTSVGFDVTSLMTNLVLLLIKLRITKRRCKQEIVNRGWSQRIFGRDQNSMSRRLDERF